MASLCDHCRKIPFSQLSCPTASDILRARQAAKNGQRVPKILPFREVFSTAPDASEEGNIRLGSLSRICQDKEHCGLCRLFYDVIQERGPRGINNTLLSEDDERIAFFARLVFFAYITESLGDSSMNGCPDAYFVLRRLCLVTKLNKIPA
ncbi:hypothetical protein VPNG_02698 [Cytospora leucostoma]|uniref:Uncharacterized protein n=1 Tax=Cytospora leucostoma TaxID=1230097 RepID=A0A423XJN5_9PEZI|nr:hypothetical protein VPNG_02698 [Cytospora leucostoma]